MPAATILCPPRQFRTTFHILPLQGSLSFDMQLQVGKKITIQSDAQELGAKLKVDQYTIIRHTVSNDPNALIQGTTSIIAEWRKTMASDEEAFTDMYRALKEMDRTDIIKQVLKVD